MPGPPPKPAGQRRRRNAVPSTVRLPAAGRVGRAPRWPLAGSVPVEARALWRSLWATPQAAAWERLGWTRVVARYALVLLAAEEPGAAASILGEARQLEDRLGLSPMSMLRLRWEVAADEVGAVRADRVDQASPEPAARRRLRAVDAGASSAG